MRSPVDTEHPGKDANAALVSSGNCHASCVVTGIEG